MGAYHNGCFTEHEAHLEGFNRRADGRWLSAAAVRPGGQAQNRTDSGVSALDGCP